MISKDEFVCPNCNNCDRQKIIFLGSDFSYQCPKCLSIHVFVENLYSKFQDNFVYHGCGSYKWKLNRYIGTYSLHNGWINDINTTAKNTHEATQYTNARIGFEKIILDKAQNDLLMISKQKISDRSLSNADSIFIANAINTKHFQDCFRAVVRIKERTLDDPSSYKILIMQSNMDICKNPIYKLHGIDEIWTVNSWNKKMDWYYILNNTNDLYDIKMLSVSITQELNKYNNTAEAISKRPGPTKYGNSLIKELLQTNKKTLRDYSGSIIEYKYIAILIRKDYPDRAGLETIDQIQSVCHQIRMSGLRPIIIACEDREENICKSICKEIDAPILIAKNLEDQIIFYSEHCCGLVGTNCSGCNIPALYDIPMFIMAKGRFFPDDFYCMGRMLSPYDCTQLFNGNLTKPNNVVEVRSMNDKPTSINNHLENFYVWLKNIHQYND